MASTYIKLQDAYVPEANKFGSWYLIGYIAPGASSASDDSPSTTNFKYYGFVTGDASAIANTNDAWVAVNKVALNDCSANNGKWNVNISGNDNGNSVSYTAEVATACAQLTPSFTKIGK